MMIKRILTVAAAGALCAAGTTFASAQSHSQGYPQGYPSSGGSYSTATTANPSDYRNRPEEMGAMPEFDDIDDRGAPAAASPTAQSNPGPILSPEDPRYGRPAGSPPVYSSHTAPQGPVMSPDDPRYGRPAGSPPVYSSHAAPQGPVLSPDDPRYGRPYTPATASYSGSADPNRPPAAVGGAGVTGSVGQQTIAALPPEDQPEVDQGGEAQLAPNLRRQEVNFVTKEPPGTIVVDTANTYLYYVLGNNRAVRYGVRVGREGFTWTGVQKISRKAEWPDWHPPTEMIERQPYLPRFMAGGPGNPLGARAMYLGSTVYRIHGTNQPSTIGKFVSSGCIGMLNQDVEDLFDRVKVGTRVVVLPGSAKAAPVTAAAQPAPAAPAASRQDATVAQAGGTTPTVVPPLPAPVQVR